MEPVNFENIPQTMKMQFLYLIHQFLREHNLTEACHEFERTHSLYFDMTYFKQLIINGSWDTLEHYLSGFTSYQTNDVSKAIFFEIGRQQFLESVARGEHEHAKFILLSRLSTIVGLEQHHLISELDNLRSNHVLQQVDVVKSREVLIQKLPQLVECDPSLNPKLELPQIVDGRLITLATHCLMLQYSKCECAMDPLSLLKDHQCPEQEVGSMTVTPPLPDRQTPVTNSGCNKPRRRRLIKTSDKIANNSLMLCIEEAQISKPLKSSSSLLAAGQELGEGESSGRTSVVQLPKRKQSRPGGNLRESQLAVVPTSQLPPPTPPPPQAMEEEEARPIGERPAWDLNVADGSEEMAEALLMLADTTVAATANVHRSE